MQLFVTSCSFGNLVVSRTNGGSRSTSERLVSNRDVGCIELLIFKGSVYVSTKYCHTLFPFQKAGEMNFLNGSIELPMDNKNGFRHCMRDSRLIVVCD